MLLLLLLSLGICERLIPRSPQKLKSVDIQVVSLKGPTMASCMR